MDAHTASPPERQSSSFLVDASLITILAVLAACGLIYEYLLSHYAGRVLGLMEHAIFTMIGVMIVSMGIGSLSAKKIKEANTGFIVIEVCIAVLGSVSIFLIAGATALVTEMPRILADNFGLPADLIPTGGGIAALAKAAEIFPFVIGFILGILVGMEIPLIARIREEVYAKRLEHNTGTVYGADYLGAGVGAAIFIIFLLTISPAKAALWVSSVNLGVGFIFLAIRWRVIGKNTLLLGIHIVAAAFLFFLSMNIETMHDALENTLYTDDIVFSEDTDFQHITLTKREIGSQEPIYTLYLNGRSQFCSCDEALYHAMLTVPPILASARHQNILLIGGGDGLAVRDLLRWNPASIDVLELDAKMISLFSEPFLKDGETINQPLIELNQQSFSDPRVNIVLGDAFNSVDALIREQKKYDVIIVDLPDPSHPDLNKLYAMRFYQKVKLLLAGDGAIAIQSTSPYHARDAFLTVGVTLRAAGFNAIERYHTNIPTFGEWGWTIATISGQGPLQRIETTYKTIPAGLVAGAEFIRASFQFPTGLIEHEIGLEPNSINNNAMYFCTKNLG
ncbi:MAG: polyamine aminopropyltransferase [Kordiimonadaceae bacterium]|nr:polyamine aminopropyltransferase [Kordiimonadaceae bacterium]